MALLICKTGAPHGNGVMLHPYYYDYAGCYYYYCSHYDHTLMMMMIILHYSRFPLPAHTPSEMLLYMYTSNLFFIDSIFLIHCSSILSPATT